MTGGPLPKRSSPSGPKVPTVLVSDRQDRPIDAGSLAGLAAKTLGQEGCGAVELSLSFVTSEEMEDLHVRYMGEPGPTDVLSFPMDEDGLLGDVVICPEVAEGSSADVASELRLLVVHGVLHLLGYDHEEERDRREMWTLQEAYSGVRSP